MSRKTRSFYQLMKYINDPEKCFDKDGNSCSISHNTHFTDDRMKNLIKEFEDNYDQYCPKHKNKVSLFHEVIAFKKEDVPHITLKKLEIMAHQYISLRAKESMCYAKVHLAPNPHIHFMFSGNLRGSSKSLRINKQEFLSIQKDMEKFQINRFPELENSVVFEDKKKTDKELKEAKLSNKEIQMKKRTHGTVKTEKEYVSEKLHSLYKLSVSNDDFFNRVIKEGFEIYKNRNKVAGIYWDKTRKKYRFKLLGIEEQHINLLQKYSSRLQELTAIRQKQLERSKQKGRGRERTREL